MKKSYARDVKRRDDVFASKSKTKIWLEKSSDDNPYIAETSFCHGYEIFDLMENCSFVEVLFLLFKGELPSIEQATLLEKLMIGLINPGPRHPATRAAMNTGIGKTNPVHILPIAATIMGGERDCAGAVECCMRFFRKQFRLPVAHSLDQIRYPLEKQQWSEIPGFGQVYGGIDLQAEKLASYLNTLDAAGEVLKWGGQFSRSLQSYGAGWLNVGVAAAVFGDLGFHPKLGGPLFQLLTAPGLIAHGVEYVSKPLTAMPYVKDDNYAIQNQS